MTTETKMKSSPNVLGAAILAAAILAGASGCADRTFLTRSHGRAYNEAFGRQAVKPEPRKAGKEDPTQGLDSQEATAVARTYRRSLAGKEGGGDPNAQQQMVLMAPAAGAGHQTGGYMPPPSVPGGQ
jgi:hypothetical protein